jgi:hypothetical protein
VPLPHIADRQLNAFLALLLTIIATIIIVPLFVPDTAHLAVARIMMSATLMLALWASGIRARRLLFFIPIVIGYLAALDFGGRHLQALAIGIRALFLTYATVLIVRHTVREQNVTADTIAGAACAYVLTALTWASLYELLEFLRPGSFDIPRTWLLQPSHDPSFGLIYFSFTTITTVGYGDIHPMSVRAGGLAMGEAVVGQLYVAIMIARLVGLQLVQRS